MKDWRLVAAGLNAGLTEAEIERIAPVLDALEVEFQRLAAALPYEAEPAVIFDPQEERP